MSGEFNSFANRVNRKFHSPCGVYVKLPEGECDHPQPSSRHVSLPTGQLMTAGIVL